MRIFIIGADGQLGTDLVQELKDYELITPSQEKLDITSFRETAQAVLSANPDFLISTAAYLDLRKCELYPRKAFQVNALATKNLAEICKEMGIPLVWISTNYVFSGEKGNYTEEDEPSPINVYGLSKLAGERFIQNTFKNYFIVRTAGLFGKNPCKGKRGKKNIIDILLNAPELKAKIDEYFTATYTRDLASAIHQMMLLGRYGIYHLFNRGRYTVYEIAKMLRGDVIPISRDGFPNSDIYPKDASLDTIKEIELPPLEDAINRYLAEK